MYLPRLLSLLEDRATSETCAGLTTGSGITAEDSGAVEIARKWWDQEGHHRTDCWTLAGRLTPTYQLVRYSSAESGVSVPPGAHDLEHEPICRLTTGTSTTGLFFDLRTMQVRLQNKNRL